MRHRFGFLFEIFRKIKLHPRGKYEYTHFIFLLDLWNTSQFKYLFIYFDVLERHKPWFNSHWKQDAFLFPTTLSPITWVPSLIPPCKTDGARRFMLIMSKSEVRNEWSLSLHSLLRTNDLHRASAPYRRRFQYLRLCSVE